ncbi:MAG: 3D domain-containing protein [Vicinamibacteraceae bacterium]
MLLASSFKRRIVVAAGAILGFCLLYEGTILDSRYAPSRVESPKRTAPATLGTRLRFSATAYCKGRTTASGTTVRRGIAAADPDLLPVGSVIQVDASSARYNGVYTVMDTGPRVQGRQVDLYMWSCHEALRFGRRPIKLTVLRLGWSPGTSGTERAKELFHRREREVMLDRAAHEETTTKAPEG